MRYAHVTNGTVDRYGRVEQYGDLWNLRDGDNITGHTALAEITAAGWKPVVEAARPQLAVGETYGDQVVTVRADDVLVSYPVVPEPAEVANERTIRSRIPPAIAANLAWLPRTAQNPTGRTSAPTNAQLLAQVDALTRQMNGVLRLLDARLDSTD